MPPRKQLTSLHAAANVLTRLSAGVHDPFSPMTSSIFDEFARYPTQQWIVWVGAGVSLAPPTRLPAGAELTWFSVRETCGAGVEERLKRLWDTINALAGTPEAEAPLGWIPRLETILGEIAVSEGSSLARAFRFMDGFESFADAPFNENHALAAALVAAGATVVTPNFDLCIQAAYQSIPGAAPLRRDRLGNTLRYARTDGRAGEIWHIHGIASDTTSLGATVSMVKEGLTREFEEMLRHRLLDGVAIAFFGYSASDSFDVTPFFTQLTNAQTRSSYTAFIQHPGSNISDSARRLVSRFERNAPRVLDTTDTLRTLVDLAGCTAPAPPATAYDWKGEFLSRSELRDVHDVRDYLVCRIANVLGVDVHRLDASAFAGAERRAGLFDRTEYHKTMAVACRPIGDARKERMHDEAVKHDDSDMLGFLYARGMLREARELAMTIPELLAYGGSGGELDWRAYTSMSVHCRIEVARRLQPFARPPRRGELAHVADLVEIARRLGARPYRGVRFVTQIATARRFGFLFEALLNGREDEDAVTDVLRLYGDAASVGGFISTYRDLGVARYFLARHHRRWRMYRPALAAATRSLRLARAAGDRAGARRAAMLRLRITAFVI